MMHENSENNHSISKLIYKTFHLTLRNPFVFILCQRIKTPKKKSGVVKADMF